MTNQVGSSSPRNWGSTIGFLLRAGIVIAILSGIFTALKSTVNPSSNDAVVNGRLTDIRAIEDGTVDVVKVKVGEPVTE